MIASANKSSSTTHTEIPPRRVLPIEDALRWAIRDELPKRRGADRGPRLGFGSVSPMFRHADLGVRVENFSREPGMPLAMGECHPDAERIEAAIAALDPDTLDIAPYQIGYGLGAHCEVELVTAIVRRDVQAWIITHAKKGGRPDVSDGPECEPACSANGKVAIWETASYQCGEAPDGTPLFTTFDRVAGREARGHSGYRAGLFCKVHWTRTVDDVAEDRARYAFWHAALLRLAQDLQDLASLAIQPPAAPATPWIAEPPPPTPLRNLIPASDVDQTPARVAGLRPPVRRADPVHRIDPSTYPLPAAA